jgi:hypothetical protein
MFLGMAPALAAETQVSISVSENLATIGDRIRVKIIVKTTVEVDKISLQVNRQDFEILEEQPEQKRQQQDYMVIEKSIEIAFFKLGEFDVGPFKVTLFKGEEEIENRETNSVPVTVKTVLREEDKDIKPLKGLVDIKGDPFYLLKYVFAAVLLVAIVILIIILVKRFREKPAVSEEPLLSPVDELEKRLNELSGRKLFEKGKTKIFFIELTQILKHFLHRVYKFNAEDFTTYETMTDLKRREKEVLILNNMEFSFNTADLVKFAKFEPDASVLDEVLKKIGEIIRVNKERAAAAALEEAS